MDAARHAIDPALDLTALREEAVEAARRGGAEVRRFFEAGFETRVKTSGRDLVTEADLASERAILAFIEDRHPDHGWQSEEAGTRPGTSPLRWVIDPLDGTANFAHGYPHFGISVAVLHHERAVAGAILDPTRDEIFSAALGQGATLNGRPARVSTIDTLDRALVSTGFPYEPHERRSRVADVTARTIERVQMLRRSGSAALDLAYVAAGRAELHWEFQINLHDVAAGLLLIHEAGGVCSELRYHDWPVGYMGANGPAMRDAVIGIIETFLGPVAMRIARPVADGDG
jgi:myo-inositol-1(or 4)-monophosphatase